MGKAELRANQSRQTALDKGAPSPEQEEEKICRQGLDNSGNIEALPARRGMYRPRSCYPSGLWSCGYHLRIILWYVWGSVREEVARAGGGHATGRARVARAPATPRVDVSGGCGGAERPPQVAPGAEYRAAQRGSLGARDSCAQASGHALGVPPRRGYVVPQRVVTRDPGRDRAQHTGQHSSCRDADGSAAGWRHHWGQAHPAAYTMTAPPGGHWRDSR
jgi:hypothetical protein